MSDNPIISETTSIVNGYTLTIKRRERTDSDGKPEIYIDVQVADPRYPDSFPLEIRVSYYAKYKQEPKAEVNWPSLGGSDVDRTRAFHAALTEALAQAATLTTPPQPAAPDDDPPDPPSCRWCDGTGTTLTGPVEDCEHCNGTGYADGKPRAFRVATVYDTPAEAAHFAAKAEAQDAPTDGAPLPEHVYTVESVYMDFGTTMYVTDSAKLAEEHAEKLHELNHDTCYRIRHQRTSTHQHEIIKVYPPKKSEAAPFQPAPTPRPVTLTAAQRKALDTLSLERKSVMYDDMNLGWYLCSGNIITGTTFNGNVIKALIKRGLLSKIDTDEYAITDAGRATLSEAE